MWTKVVTNRHCILLFLYHNYETIWTKNQNSSIDESYTACPNNLVPKVCVQTPPSPQKKSGRESKELACVQRPLPPPPSRFPQENLRLLKTLSSRFFLRWGERPYTSSVPRASREGDKVDQPRFRGWYPTKEHNIPLTATGVIGHSW